MLEQYLTDNSAAMPLPWVVVVAGSLISAIQDLRDRRIPNLLTGPLLLTGIIWNTFARGTNGFLDAAAGCVVLAVPYVFLFLYAKGGAGDAKLMGAIGAWLGLVQGIAVLVIICVVGILLSLGYSVIKGRAYSVLANVAEMTGRVIFGLLIMIRGHGHFSAICGKPAQHQEKLTIPYGVAIFVGVCCSAIGELIWHI